MCSLSPKCCAPARGPPQSCCPTGQKPLEKLRSVKRHYCCTAGSKCDMCSKQSEFCLNYLRNKQIVGSLSCLLRITQFQVLSTLFRLACDEIKPQWHYPRDRVWSVMENVKTPYTELLDLKIYHSLYDRFGQPIDLMDRTNAYKVIRLIFLMPALVPDHRERVLAMLRQLNSRAICPVNLEGLLMIMNNLRLDRLVFDILEQDARLRRFHGAREFLNLCRLYQEQPASENRTGVERRRRRKKNLQTSAKNSNSLKKRKSVTVPIFCTRRPMQAADIQETSNRVEEPFGRSEPTSRRSSISSQRRSSIQKNLAPTQGRSPGAPGWIPAAGQATSYLLPHSTPVLGLRSLYLSW